ncbi:hypothetical protein EXS54_02205 [Patescibacteria group bacterium]|nr:hypothetical protein [Patescibacteria group bacterium]
MNIPSFGLKTVAQVALAGVMAFGLTAAVNTLASSGKTQLTVITHLDTAKPGKLNERLSGVQYVPSCKVGKNPLALSAVVRQTDANGEASLNFNEQVKNKDRVFCSVKVPESFHREGKAYTLLSSENNPKETLFKRDVTSVVRFNYKASE